MSSHVTSNKVLSHQVIRSCWVTTDHVKVNTRSSQFKVYDKSVGQFWPNREYWVVGSYQWMSVRSRQISSSHIRSSQVESGKLGSTEVTSAKLWSQWVKLAKVG